MIVGDWLGKRSLLTPHKVGLIDKIGHRRITFGEWNRRANRVANFLQSGLGIKKGDRVAILAQNSAEYLDLFFACGKLGAIFQPLNWRLTVSELEYIINDGGPAVLFYGPEYAPAAAQLRTLCASVRSWVSMTETQVDSRDVLYADVIARAADRSPDEVPLTLDDPWAILYTGGTTGYPKGALLTHGNITWNSVNTIVSWALRQEDVIPLFTPLFHTGGLNVFTAPLVHMGGTSLLADFNPETLFDLIDEERPTIVFMVPTMFLMVMQQPRWARASFEPVRQFLSGGAPCPQAIFEAYWDKGKIFKQGYGLTEAGPNNFFIHPDDVKRKLGSVGFPLFHIDLKLVDDNGHEVGADEVGELLIRGPHVCAGYWNKLQETAATFVEGWLHTGDLARRDAEGFHWIVDRKKDMLISGGENIYPAEVENVLHSHPAIAEAALIGIPDPKWGEVGRAVVALKPGMQAGEQDIIEFCRHHLARYKVPKSVVFVDSLPKSAANKVLKRTLREQYA